MNTGVYQIYNTVTGKRYVGSTITDFNKRWIIHKCLLRKNQHHSPYLQASFNKHGEDSFEYIILEYCKPEHCIQREQWWMDLFGVYNREYGYNATVLAGNVTGHKVSEENKKKLSLVHKGNKYASGCKRSEETKQKLRLAKLGTKFSKEYCEKRSLMYKGKNNPNYGKKHTEEARRKISNSKIRFVYKIISPCNEEIIINNLREFCKDNSLDQAAMMRVVNGKANHHKGYKGFKLQDLKELENGINS